MKHVKPSSVFAAGTIFVLVFTAVLVRSPFRNASPTVENQVETQKAPPDWITFHNQEYSLQHPSEVIVDTAMAGGDTESTRFRFMGPKQIASGRTQTSLFDGYIVVVTPHGLAEAKSSEKRATESRANSLESCGSQAEISELHPVQVGSDSGVQYQIRNCMSDSTNTFVTHNNKAYEVTQIYVGEAEDQARYETITNQMVASLIFE